MLNLKTQTNVSTSYNFLCIVGDNFIDGFFDGFQQKSDTQRYLFGDLLFLDCRSLFIIEFSISGNCSYYSVFGSNYDFVFIYDNVDEFEQGKRSPQTSSYEIGGGDFVLFDVFDFDCDFREF